MAALQAGSKAKRRRSAASLRSGKIFCVCAESGCGDKETWHGGGCSRFVGATVLKRVLGIANDPDGSVLRGLPGSLKEKAYIDKESGLLLRDYRDGQKGANGKTLVAKIEFSLALAELLTRREGTVIQKEWTYAVAVKAVAQGRFHRQHLAPELFKVHMKDAIGAASQVTFNWGATSGKPASAWHRSREEIRLGAGKRRTHELHRHLYPETHLEGLASSGSGLHVHASGTKAARARSAASLREGSATYCPCSDTVNPCTGLLTSNTTRVQPQDGAPSGRYKHIIQGPGTEALRAAAAKEKLPVHINHFRVEDLHKTVTQYGRQQNRANEGVLPQLERKLAQQELLPPQPVTKLEQLKLKGAVRQHKIDTTGLKRKNADDSTSVGEITAVAVAQSGQVAQAASEAAATAVAAERAARGVCRGHGSKCSVARCVQAADGWGLCKRHGANGACSVAGCGTNARTPGGTCCKHGSNKLDAFDTDVLSCGSSPAKGKGQRGEGRGAAARRLDFGPDEDEVGGEDEDEGGICLVAGCGLKVQAGGMCRKHGCPKAQYNLGRRYEKGTGVVKDYGEAVRLYQLAANQGHAGARCNLAACYEEGTGVDKDCERAVRLFQLAADQGHADARFYLAFLYEEGTGVGKDCERAAQLYQLAAAQGHAHAQNNLGCCYWEGKGVAKGCERAAQLFQLAADQGHAEARFNLAACLADQGHAKAAKAAKAKNNDKPDAFDKEAPVPRAAMLTQLAADFWG